jgi:predicted N-acetyltransferase YhbS
VSGRHSDRSPALQLCLGGFVCPEYRREGIASALVERFMTDMRHLGYSRVLLYASVIGHPVYEALGFTTANKMQADLVA